MINFKEIANRVSLLDVCSDHGVEFNNKGFALCPFHDDHKPSLSLHPSKEYLKCFACGVVADSIEIEYRLGNHSNKLDAVKALNQRYSLNINMNENTNTYKKNDDVVKLLDFYINRTNQFLLKNKEALRWLEENKGISIDDVKKYKIGYTGKGWLATSNKTDLKELAVKVGLLIKKDNNCYDYFRNRIMFPILINGSIAGIWTRRFPDNENNSVKWLGLKSSEYIPYKPIPFRENLNRDICIVTESIPDSIAFLKAGYPSVSLLGSEVSQENKQYFEKAKSKLYFGLDPDSAGKSASYKLAKEFKGYVIDLGYEKDPDEIFVQLGLEKFKDHISKCINSAKSYKSIIEEERLLTSSDYVDAIHPSMNYIDNNLMYGFSDGVKPYFISNYAVYDYEDIKEKYNLSKKPSSNRFSKEGLKKYIEKTDVDFKVTINEIVNLLKKYLVFQDTWQPYIIACWLAGTYLYRCFPLYPYLWIQSPTKRCGKTRLLELCSELAFNCDGIQTAPTEAILYRDPEISGGTLCWDEVENLSRTKETGERIGIINSAYRKGSSIKRCDGKDNKVKSFEVFRPLILAGISSLPDTIIDRSIRIELIRKTETDRVTRLQLDKIRPAIQVIRDNLYIFALSRTPKILEAYENFKDTLIPESVDDRLRDGLEIIYSVASAFYLDDTTKLKDVIQILNHASISLSTNRNEEEEDISFARAISLLKEESDNNSNALILKAAEAVSLFQDGGIDWVQEPKHAKSLLRKLGFRSGVHRGQNGMSIRGYKIDKNRLNNLYIRYCKGIPPEKTVTSVTFQ